MIEFDDVSHNFGDLHVLNHINLRIKAGDFALVVGAPKSGKTTIFRILKKELKLGSGHIRINGMDLNEYENNDLYQDVEFMPELFFLDESLTVRSNMVLINRKPKISYLECLSKLGIQNLYHRQVQLLNGLEKRQVYLASILTFNPKILIIDDISSNLDLKRAKILYDHLIKLNQEGVTILALTKHLSYGQFVKKSYHLEDGHLI